MSENNSALATIAGNPTIQINLNEDELSTLAMAVEEIFHGNWVDQSLHGNCKCGCGGNNVNWEAARREYEGAVATLKSLGINYTSALITRPLDHLSKKITTLQ